MTKTTVSVRQSCKSAAWMLWLGLCGLLVMSTISMMVGKYGAGPVPLYAAAKAALTGGAVDPILSTVLWNIRLPRVLAGLCVGAALSAAGATYQGLFRNPLVSPDILGVSAGASLGAVLGIFLSATIGGRDPVLTLVLAGVAIGALVGAGISLIKILADPYDQLPAITYWLLGSLTAVTRFDVLSILPALIIGIIPLVLLRWRMNVMTLGDDEAQTIGVDTFRIRALLIAAVTLITAASVSVTGIIGWVGLIIPHIARMLVGPDFRKLLPASMVLGGGYLLVVDMLARSIALIEVPLGILTAAVGAPFFLWLLAAGKRGWQ